MPGSERPGARRRRERDGRLYRDIDREQHERDRDDAQGPLLAASARLPFEPPDHDGRGNDLDQGVPAKARKRDRARRDRSQHQDPRADDIPRERPILERKPAAQRERRILGHLNLIVRLAAARHEAPEIGAADHPPARAGFRGP